MDCYDHWSTVEYEADYLHCSLSQWAKACDDHYYRTQDINPVTGKRRFNSYTTKWIYCQCANENASLLEQEVIDKEIERLQEVCVSSDSRLCFFIYFLDGKQIKRQCRVCGHEEDYKEVQ
jgi:hypothetical protein